MFKTSRQSSCIFDFLHTSKKLADLQWNLHKTDTIGEQPFGRYREVVFLERLRKPTTVCSMSQFLLQMNLGALLTASLAHTSFEKAVGTSYS